MANVDTGLGWSIEQRYLTDSPVQLGNLTRLVPATTYMAGGMLPTGSPTPADVVGRGILVCINNFRTNYYTYALAAVGVSAVAVSLTSDPPSTANPRDVCYISDTPDALVYEVEWNIDTQEMVGSLKTRTLSNTSGGFYYITPAMSQSQGWDTSMIPHYASRALAMADLTKSTQPVYKLQGGPAGGAWVRWIDLNGNYVTAPTLISTTAANTQLSLDGLAPAASATSAGLLYQGRTFTLTLIPGHTGGYSGATVPFLDLTAAFPRPIGLSVVIEAICVAENILVTDGGSPYGDPTEPGGGDGSADDEDDVDHPVPPSGGSVGFYRIWNPSETDLRDLSSWLWAQTGSVLDVLRSVFADPINTILGLSIVPVTPSRIGGYNIHLGGVDTGIEAYTVTDRYVTLDCGSINVEERWGAYLDYSPYTKMAIYLPYIGFRDIDTDDVMHKTVSLQYIVDVLSGACVATLKAGSSVLYSWQGQCSQQLPITNADWTNGISAAVGIAGAAVTAIASGGTSAPLLAGAVASASVNALSLKPRFTHSGNIGGPGGFLGVQTPYLVRSRPEQAVPGQQGHMIGYPSFITELLDNVSGYCEVERVHLEGVPATSAELEEIEQLLGEGVIL